LWGRGGGQRRLTPLTGLALACVVCGIVFTEERVVGYAFFLVGILLAIIDAVRRSREGHRPPE
jgi:EamA domain-containing membrane protein RarD